MSLLERFTSYVKIDTQSELDSGRTPSTEKQFDLARLLIRELAEMGIKDAELTEDCYVYAKIPGNLTEEEAALTPTIGFLAHLDTSPDAPGANVHPQLIRAYDGGEIPLGDKGVLSPERFPELLSYKGDDLVVTDGTTLLGADDKAGIAEIMELTDYLTRHPEVRHGDIAIGFTPDEELGLEADGFQVDRFGAEFAYTLDGGAVGEIVYENFNAASAKVTFQGVEVHPCHAKNIMVNSQLAAMEFSALLPECRPETTEGYEGFFHLIRMSGRVEKTVMDYLIRDHNWDKFEEKKDIFFEAASFLQKKYAGTGLKIQVEMKDQYYNMRSQILHYPFLLDLARDAYRSIGVEPFSEPMRGGTDGAKYSFLGLPCPNLATGGGNAHGKYEYASVQKMEQMVQVLLHLSQSVVGIGKMEQK